MQTNSKNWARSVEHCTVMYCLQRTIDISNCGAAGAGVGVGASALIDEVNYLYHNRKNILNDLQTLFVSAFGIYPSIYAYIIKNVFYS